MKKNNLLFGFFIIVFLIVLVSAVVPVVQLGKESIVHQDGTTTFTNIPVKDYNVIGFICGDATCSTTSGSLFGGSVLNSGDSDSILLNYPTTLQSPYGYGIYFYKEGYIPWEVSANWWGSLPKQGPFDAYFGKKEGCRATVDNFEVTNDVNPNQPIQFNVSTSLDADTQAALSHSGPLDFVPPSIANHYMVETEVNLEVIDSNNGNLVFTDNNLLNINYSNSERVEFTWIPNYSGNFTATVYSDVTDSKCSSSFSQNSSKNFNVIPTGPTNMCYTLLNNLEFNIPNPTVEDHINVTANKISNEADSFGSLTSLGTDLWLTVTKLSDNSTEVRTMSLPPNPDTVNPVSFTFDVFNRSPEGGDYLVTLNGNATGCSQPINTADQISATIFVQGIQSNNTSPVISGLPDQTFLINSGFHNDVIDLWLFSSDVESNVNELSFNIVSESNTSVVDCNIDSNQFIDCSVNPNTTGFSYIEVRVSDSEGLNDSDVFRVDVVSMIGSAPFVNITSPVDGSVFTNESVINFVGSAIDAEDGVLTGNSLTWSSSIDGFLGNGQNINIISLSVGNHTIGLTAMDSDSNNGSDSINVIINEVAPPVNRPPVLNPIGNKFVNEEELLEFELNFSDPDGDSLVCSAFNLPLGSVFNNSNCVFSWTPNNGQDGVYTDVGFLVDDGSLNDTELITITVNDSIQPPVNTAPVISGLPNQTFLINSGFHDNVTDLYLFSTDLESPDNFLIFDVVSESNTSVVDCDIEFNRFIDCNVQLNITGFSYIEVLVSDGFLTDTDVFRVDVVSMVGSAPVVNITSPLEGSSFVEGTNINFVGIANDVEDGVLIGNSLTWSSSIDGFLGNGQNINISSLGVGSHLITLTAIDSDSNNGSDFVNIVVSSRGGGGGGGGGGGSGGGGGGRMRVISPPEQAPELFANQTTPLEEETPVNANVEEKKSNFGWFIWLLIVLIILLLVIIAYYYAK